jgi:hypothetical protein
MKSDFEERRQKRIERLEELSGIIVIVGRLL